MQLGIGSYTYGWAVELNAIEEMDLIGRAKQFGVSLLQLGDNIPLHAFDERSLTQFELALKANNIKLEIGARGLTEENLVTYIQLCKRFDAKLLRFIIDGKDYEPSIEAVKKIISAHKSLLEENKITLALENHDRFKAREYAEIINSINSKFVGICLDTVNSMGAGESLETIIEILAPLTVNLHIKDFGISRLPHKQGFVIDGRIAGEGLLNIQSLLEKLKAYNRCHTCVLEQWVPPEKEKDSTIDKEKNWAEKSMEYLKEIVNGEL